MNTSTERSANKADEDEILQKQRETFVASLSHDLKNPTLAQIRAIELILKGNFGEVSPKQREIMEMLLDSCKYMNAMLGNVLQTYRTDKGTVSLTCEQISLANVTKECLEEMIYLAKDKNIKISYENCAYKDTIWGDIVQIRRVIMNLLSNSIKYAYQNTNLEIKIYNEDEFTCFMFKNNSPYITPEKQKKIFARYISFSKTHSGIGLGLYASNKIVEAHGGTMFVKSEKDEHNTFGFKIPNNDSLKDKKRFVTF